MMFLISFIINQHLLWNFKRTAGRDRFLYGISAIYVLRKRIHLI